MSTAREDSIIVVGDLPPPVHGQAIVTDHVISVLRQHAGVAAFDLGPQGSGSILRRQSRRFGAVLRALMAIVRRRPRALYMALAGGYALALNLVICLAARLCCARIFLHHHSFAYIDRRTRLMAWLCRAVAEQATHIFLCPHMAYAFRKHYPAVRVREVSNATFCGGTPASSAFHLDGALRVGLLSNLSQEKGLTDLLELLHAAQAEGFALHGVLAGPVARARDRHALTEAQRTLGARLEWRGPLDEAGKAAFFGDVDVFCLPTRYRHEAQPLVVLEALAHGVPVVAYARGCLIDMAQEPALTIVDPGVPFDRAAISVLEQFARNDETLARARMAARAYYERLAEESRVSFHDLIYEVAAIANEALSVCTPSTRAKSTSA